MSDNVMEPNVDRVGARQVLDALADGAYITDASRRIVFWSRAAERITGWRADEVVGHRCADNILVHVDKDGHRLCEEEYCPLHRAIVTGQHSSEPLLVFAQHKQGHRIPVEVSVAPLQDHSGRTVGGIEVFRDLTSVMDDLRRAKVIQDHVLDSRVPEDLRVKFGVSYRPEELVGGDFYRVDQLDGDRYAVMIADVMGHGIASALYTMQLRAIWDECRSELVSPGRFLSLVNTRLHRLASADGYFATGICVLVDVASGKLVYVRAGHPPALLLRSDGAIERLGQRSNAIGLLEHATYPEAVAEMRPGDTLLLYTDGAIEILNSQDEELGEQGFVNLLRSLGQRAIDLAQIEKSLLEYTNRIRLPDDLTLLTVTRAGSALA